jgi:hypothetical protein
MGDASQAPRLCIHKMNAIPGSINDSMIYTSSWFSGIFMVDLSGEKKSINTRLIRITVTLTE